MYIISCLSGWDSGITRTAQGLGWGLGVGCTGHRPETIKLIMSVSDCILLDLDE